MAEQPRKKVVWDEGNLTENEEYRRLHPVTMRIDEPKTPYVEMTEEERRLFDDEEELERLADMAKAHAAAGGGGGDGGDVAVGDGSSWDHEVNSVARQAKLALPAHDMGCPSPSPSAPLPPKAVPVSAPEPTAAWAPPAEPAGKKMRPQLQLPAALQPTFSTSSSVPGEQEEQHHLTDAEFRAMRRKVYADEGAKFLLQQKALKQQVEEEDGDDDGE